MYLAMNRFRVMPDQTDAFEKVWTSRDSYLRDSPGFVEFNLLRGPTRDDHVLYSSHTVWRSYADFEAWTRSDAFKSAHRGASTNRAMYAGSPEFEGFQSVQRVAMEE